MFIDESERQKSPNNKYYFVLCGMLIPAEYLLEAESVLKDFKSKEGLTNLKELKDVERTKEAKLEVTKALFGILNSYKVKVIATCLGTYTLRQAERFSKRYTEGLFFLVERFYLHLKSIGEQGMMIFDTLGSRGTEQETREWFHKYVSEESLQFVGYTDVNKFSKRVYPNIFFMEDKYSNLLQVTDLISTSLNKAIFDCINKDSHVKIEELNTFNEYLNIYWPLFNRRGMV